MAFYRSLLSIGFTLVIRLLCLFLKNDGFGVLAKLDSGVISWLLLLLSTSSMNGNWLLPLYIFLAASFYCRWWYIREWQDESETYWLKFSRKAFFWAPADSCRILLVLREGDTPKMSVFIWCCSWVALAEISHDWLMIDDLGLLLI